MCSRVLGTTKIWGCPTPAFSSGKSARTVPNQEASRLHALSPFLSPPPPLKTLQLSNSMHPQYISFQILLALKCSSYNALFCQGLDLIDDSSNRNVKNSSTKNDDSTNSSSSNDGNNNNNNDNNNGDTNIDNNNKVDNCVNVEDNQTALEITPASSYLQHLKVLINSRKWLRIEFDQCKGVESLFCDFKERRLDETESSSSGLTTNTNTCTNRESTSTAAATCTTEVVFLSLKFPRSSKFAKVNASCAYSYDEDRHANFFTNLWNYWRVQKLDLSMEFSPAWTKEFCRSLCNDGENDNHSHNTMDKTNPKKSGLEELQLHPACTWHRQSETAKREDGDDRSSNSCSPPQSGNRNQTSSSDCSNAVITRTIAENDDDMDCWELFCRQLPINHPRLKHLTIQCKARDEDLAYLIKHGISSPPFLALETLRFGKMCSCGDLSLVALARALTLTTATTIASTINDEVSPCYSQRLKILSMSSGTKLPSSSSALLADIHQQQRGLVDVCHALETTTALTHLEIFDYVLDQTELRVLLESLVKNGGSIERLSLLTCGVTSPVVYKTFQECLTRNQLPFLKVLLLPEPASKFLGKALEFNTSIESINYSRGGSPNLRYYLDLNRGGRRILTNATTNTNTDAASTKNSNRHFTSSNSTASENTVPTISPALYPRILDRASHMKKHGYLGTDKRRYDVVYCLLRNRILLEL